MLQAPMIPTASADPNVAILKNHSILSDLFIFSHYRALRYSRVELSLDFSLYGFYNKKFIRDGEFAEIESKILPQVIRTETRRHSEWC